METMTDTDINVMAPEISIGTRDRQVLPAKLTRANSRYFGPRESSLAWFKGPCRL